MIYLKTLVLAVHRPALTFILLPLLTMSACQTAPDALKQKAAQPPPPSNSSPSAHIYVDEARLAKPYAVIGGTVQNVSVEKLQNLSVEVELRRRADSGVETREVKVEPSDLEPGKQGRFSLKVLSEEWSGTRVIGLRSGAQEVVFRSLPGAKRPPERIKDNVTIVKTPAKKRSNDDFINTPDTPYSVP